VSRTVAGIIFTFLLYMHSQGQVSREQLSRDVTHQTLEWTNSKDPELRLSALANINFQSSLIGTKTAASVLNRLLQDPVSHVRSQATRTAPSVTSQFVEEKANLAQELEDLEATLKSASSVRHITEEQTVKRGPYEIRPEKASLLSFLALRNVYLARQNKTGLSAWKDQALSLCAHFLAMNGPYDDYFAFQIAAALIDNEAAEVNGLRVLEELLRRKRTDVELTVAIIRVVGDSGVVGDKNAIAGKLKALKMHRNIEVRKAAIDALNKIREANQKQYLRP
jgi:hypothetical protein